MKTISEILGLGCKGHVNFNFVDISPSCDTRLFIDPCLIDRAQDQWSQGASALLQAFMDCLVIAFRDKTDDRRLLLEHAKEQNATKLGYGNGNNGKGKTPLGLYESLRGLTDLIQRIPTIKKASDLKVFVQKFGEDNMSDLITNILHLQLNEFTLNELARWGKEPNGEMSFWTWDMVSKKWTLVKKPCFTYNGNEILLVPKWIVRKNYLFSVHQYMYTVVFDRMREAGYENWSKRDIWLNIPHTSDDWEYRFALSRTFEDPSLLARYHERIPKHYNRCYGSMSDESLDMMIYGRTFQALA